VITRLATADDIPALVRLINSAYRVAEFFVIGDRTTVEDISTRMTTPDACFLVIDASEPRQLAGAVYVDVHEGRGHFGLLSVDPNHQGQGIGRALVRAAEDHCRAANCRSLDLEVVNLRTELPAWYQALGFEPFGTAPFPRLEKLSQDAHLVLWTKLLARERG
jgi:ribosomal protein S18 acetylase RimI-like enzyme